MRFSIRDLLWLTLVVAMGLGWWLEHQRQRETDAKRLEAVQQAHRLHHSLDLAKKWHDLGRSGYFTTGAKNVLPVPSSQPDWAPLDEPLVEP